MKKSVFVLIATFCSVTLAVAQQKSPPPSTVIVPIYQTQEINYKYHDGVALLRDGSILKGRFLSNGRRIFTYRATSQAVRKKIGVSMIQRLSLAGSDTLVTDRKDSTIFLRMGNRLYRQLAAGPTMIMDQRYTVDEDRGQIGSRLYVIDENSEFHKFSSLKKLNDWFYALQQQSGKRISDSFLNQNEIVKAVAILNKK